jgi:hypothetical protein
MLMKGLLRLLHGEVGAIAKAGDSFEEVLAVGLSASDPPRVELADNAHPSRGVQKLGPVECSGKGNVSMQSAILRPHLNDEVGTLISQASQLPHRPTQEVRVLNSIYRARVSKSH